MRQLPAASAPPGWRRVPVGEENRTLGAVASTHRYHVAELNLLYANFDRRVEPVFGETDQVFEPELADTVKAAVAELIGEDGGSLRGTDLRRLLVSITRARRARPGPGLAARSLHGGGRAVDLSPPARPGPTQLSRGRCPSRFRCGHCPLRVPPR
jgi:hypothetical protein